MSTGCKSSHNGFLDVIVARRMILLLRAQRQAHNPSAGTAESQMPSLLSWGLGRAATLLKTLLQYYGKSLGVARCCLPQSPGQLQHLKYQNRI